MKIGKLDKNYKIFRFLDLPFDIRFIIYKMRLHHRSGLVRFFHWYNPYGGKIVRPSLGVNLLRTCHQIYDESIDVLYGLNTFCALPDISMKHTDLVHSYSDANYSRWEWCHLHAFLDGINYDGAFGPFKLMGRENRNRIKHLEMMLPEPNEICLYHFKPMKPLFSNLTTLTLFSDGYERWAEQELLAKTERNASAGFQTWTQFYERLAELFPTAEALFIDLNGRTGSLQKEESIVLNGFRKYAPSIKPSNFKIQSQHRGEGVHKMEIVVYQEIQKDFVWTWPDWRYEHRYPSFSRRLFDRDIDDESEDEAIEAAWDMKEEIRARVADLSQFLEKRPRQEDEGHEVDGHLQ